LQTSHHLRVRQHVERFFQRLEIGHVEDDDARPSMVGDQDASVLGLDSLDDFG
jgi:hypothetical protein